MKFRINLRFLLFIFLLGVPTITLGDTDRITGVWSYETDEEFISIAIKSNDDSFLAFRLSGPAQRLTAKMVAWGKAQAITESFRVFDRESLLFLLPIKGAIQVPDPKKSDGSTKREEVIVRLRAKLEGEALLINTEHGNTLIFKKTNLLNYLFEYLKLVFSTAVSLFIFIVVGVFYLKLFVNRYKAISKLKVDHRYSAKGGLRFRGGKNGNAEWFWLIAGTVIIFVIHFGMLGYLKIGGFSDHVGFWIY